MQAGILAVTAVVVLGAASGSAEARPDDELARQLQELRERVQSQQATLEAQQSQIQSQASEIEKLRSQVPNDWLTEQRAQEIKGLVTEVLADADSRASLLQGAPIAGHDGKNFFIGSSDGNFLLKVGGQIQPRYIANTRDDASGSVFVPADDNEFGFQVRRVKLYFEGHVFDPKLTYKFQGAANRDSGAFDIEEAVVGYQTTDQLKLVVGRFVDPLLRDSFTSNTRQLAVERSITSYVFASNDNYSEGVGGDWRGDAWRFRTTVTDGIGSGTPGGAGNDFFNDNTDFAATGRVDWRVAGNWKQMDDYSAWAEEPTATFIGAAVHYELAESGDNQATAPAYDSFITFTLDGSFECGGFNAYGAVIGQQVDAIAGGTNLDNMGFLVQAGYMIVPDKLEPFARYEVVDIDGAPDELGIITAGFNYYWRGHSLKFTADVIYCLDPVTSASTLGASGSTGTGLAGMGLLADNPASDGQTSLRAQFQLLF